MFTEQRKHQVILLEIEWIRKYKSFTRIFLSALPLLSCITCLLIE
jgi:hypothetical protein